MLCFSCCQDFTFCCQNSAGWDRNGSDALLTHKVGQAFAFLCFDCCSFECFNSFLQAQLLKYIFPLINPMICELKFEIIMLLRFSGFCICPSVLSIPQGLSKNSCNFNLQFVLSNVLFLLQFCPMLFLHNSSGARCMLGSSKQLWHSLIVRVEQKKHGGTGGGGWMYSGAW